MFSNILICCVGNICRSPMAEALFRQRASTQLNTSIEVRSAGTQALIGHAPDILAIQLMKERHLDISEYGGTKLNVELAHGADIILVMETSQKKVIEQRHPTTRGKVFRLLEDEKQDIPDPYRQDIEAFKAALSLIERGVDEWVGKLA
ncbi:MAG: low molecular weight phosphotyrosine protein phosphatase [Gammaproteobacteria bacterium]|nr:low molecular weight phosphotyrosine protein phosphatase [Gammaproteobacteria bacterium]